MVGGYGQPGQPRRRRLSPTATETVLLVVGLAGLAFAAGAGGWVLGRQSQATVANAPPVVWKATATATTEAAPGNPVAGKTVFANAGCGSCHTLRAAGATGTVGPRLDEKKWSIEAVTTWVKDGKGAMPPYKGKLSGKEIADLASFIAQSTGR